MFDKNCKPLAHSKDYGISQAGHSNFVLAYWHRFFAPGGEGWLVILSVRHTKCLN